MALRLAWLTLAAGVLLLLCIASVAYGVRAVTFDDILAGIGGDTGTISEAAVAKRMPRTVLAILVGGALAVSGAAMQAVTRNPLADPGILGVISGAALAVVIGIAFFGMSSPYAYMGTAIAGAAAAAVFVYAIGSLGRGGASPLKLALAGAATSAALTSLVGAILLPRVDLMQNYQFWQIGGVGGATWDRIGVVGPVLAVGAGICFLSARGMNNLALGDDMAAGLGENVMRTRLIASLGAVILCGAATAVAGPIAFVAFLSGPIAARIVGPHGSPLIPAALVGVTLVLGADLVGQFAFDTRFPVGVVTGALGAPYLVYLIARTNRTGGSL